MQNPDAVLALNLEGKIVAVNPQAERLFEYKEEFLINKCADILLSLDEIDQITAYFNQVLNKETVKFEITFHDIKDQMKIIRCSLFPDYRARRYYRSVCGHARHHRCTTGRRVNDYVRENHSDWPYGCFSCS